MTLPTTRTAAERGALHSASVATDPSRPVGSPVVWVCLPTYNEAENIGGMVAGLLSTFEESGLNGHVLVIDDNSPDGTGSLADELAEMFDRVSVLHRPQREGIGPAYVAGFREALDAGADLVIEMDCDFSHDPAAVPALVRAADQADLVLGSRYIPGGGTQNWGLLRRAISRGGCLYARAALGIAPHDLTGGFKCFHRAVLETIPLGEVTGTGYVFQVEMTYRAILLGYRVVEVPITFRDRTAGTSKMSKGIVMEAAVHVPRLRWQLRDARKAPVS
jgi:dolichol-phosphate mannosyltransferase